MPEEKKVYVKQEEHSAEDCKINENPHNSPETDCGHFVDADGDGYGDGPANPNSHGNEATGPGIGL